MRYSKPVFFDKFNCTADQCPDTCCAGWQIMIDDDSLDYYGSVKGAFGKRLKDSIDWQEGAFCQNNRRCAFLNDSNLCDIYIALGPEALCETCRKYPRHVEEFEGVREWSLSLSCPVAAKIILSQQGFWEFDVEEDDEADELEEEFEDFDFLLFTQLEDARSAVFERLKKGFENDQANSFCLQRHMDQALQLAGEMQLALDEGNFFQIEELISEYQTKDASAECREKDQYERMVQLFEDIYHLERLRPEWSDVLEEMRCTLYEDGEEAYVEQKKAFDAYLTEDKSAKTQWENIGLQLFTFFVFTYFCGAVYSDWIYTKMGLAVHSVEFIRELFLARWIKSGKLTIEDYIELSYRYAREIEHSDQNLNELEEIFAEEYGKNFE